MSRRVNKDDIKRESYIQLPRWLTTEEKYKGLSNDAKFAYAILKDRYRLSEHTTESGSDAYVDEEGDIYFVYTIKELMDILGVSDKTVTKIKRSLISAGLLDEVRQGQGKTNRYYLLQPTFDEPNQSEKKAPQTVGGVETRKNSESKVRKNTNQNSEKVRPIKKDLSELDLSNFEEEEYILRARAENIAYDILNDFLRSKQIDQVTINQTILQMIEHDLDLFLMQDVEKQFGHMMNKKHYGERIYDFAKYFVKGLKDLTIQSSASRQYQEEKLREYEAARERSRQNAGVFYNWLEA